MGIVAALYDYDWKEAERRFHLAMDHDPVPPRVRQWYGHTYLLPIGWIEESLKQQELGVQEDPLNVISTSWLGATLWSVQKKVEAQEEIKKSWELEESHPWTSSLLALFYARRKNYIEALHIVEKASSKPPLAIGVLAGVLKCLGKVSRAEKLIQNLMSGDPYGVPLGLSFFHFLCEEVDKAAEWWEKVIEQRHPLVSSCGSVFFRSTSYWPVLAELMNLPEEASIPATKPSCVK